MFSTNEGTTDRTIRGMLGLVLLVAAFVVLSGALQWIVTVISIILLVTGIAGICPLYRLLGINTCPVDTGNTRS
jgi:hypothetical protein